jgi:ornithine carbamoyltransferase
MAIQFTRNGRKAMLWAQVEAMRRGDLYVEPEHLLLGLMHGENTGALRLVYRMGLSGVQVRDAVAALLAPEAAGARVDSSQLSPSAKKVVEQARRETEVTGDDYVGTEHLLLAILRGYENGIAAKPGLMDSLGSLRITYTTAAEAVKTIGSEMPTILDPSVVKTAARPIVTARPGFLHGRDLLSIEDLSPEEVRALFELTREIKTGRTPKNGDGKSLALLFEKPSLRTKVTFSVGMARLGGTSVYLSKEEVGLGVRETVPDAARCLSRWVDAIAIRTASDTTLRELAEYASVPVINALTDREHPCQALADFYTILESRSETHGMKLVFVGDGNNVAVSLMLLAPVLGTHFTLCCPPGYEPPADLLDRGKAKAKEHGTNFEISHDPLIAADDADILYTDVWTSMGQETETKKRKKDFAKFAINAEMIREAKEDVLVLHCLPAHRGDEITDEVMDGPFSGVFDQAENRLHVQQALLSAVL